MGTAAKTRRVVRAFLSARDQGDAALARSYLAPDFTFESPLMRFDDPAAYLDSHIRFQRLVTGLDVIDELYGPAGAVRLYDLHTATPAGTQRTTEHFRIQDGAIRGILLIFDTLPWRPMFGVMGVKGS